MSRVAALYCAVLLVPIWFTTPNAVTAAPGQCFPETGKCISDTFISYWQSHGGLAQQGYPITNEISETNPTDGKTYTAQYFERARFEYHPDNAAPYKVLLGLLGREQYLAKYPTGRPVGGTGEVCFTETGRCISSIFAVYWNQNGGLEQQGYPISDEFDEVNPTNGRTYRVQYFERARFEYHPENTGSAFQVLLGLVGREQFLAKYPPPATSFDCPGGPVKSVDPLFDPGVGSEDRLAIPTGISRASCFLETSVGGDRRSSFAVRAIDGVSQGNCCYANRNIFFLYVRDNDWTNANIDPSRKFWADPARKQEISAHEYIHLWQFELGCVTENYPVWIIEGMAEYLGYQVMIRYGEMSADRVKQFAVNGVKVSKLGPLSDYEGGGHLPSGGYSLVYLAAQQLVAQRGLLSFRSYCTSVGAGMTWQDAFQQAFGISVATFYEQFEQYRKQP